MDIAGLPHRGKANSAPALLLSFGIRGAGRQQAASAFTTVSVSRNLWQKGDEATKPSIVLTAEIEIPELVSITPKSLNWKAGEVKGAKTYRISVHEGETIHVTGVVTTNNHFVPQLKTVTEGKIYEITITPKDTSEAGFGILKITTDSQNPRYRRLQGFVTINR